MKYGSEEYKRYVAEKYPDAIQRILGYRTILEGYTLNLDRDFATEICDVYMAARFNGYTMDATDAYLYTHARMTLDNAIRKDMEKASDALKNMGTLTIDDILK